MYMQNIGCTYLVQYNKVSCLNYENPSLLFNAEFAFKHQPNFRSHLYLPHPVSYILSAFVS